MTSVIAGIAQWLERLFCKQRVVGSNPSAGSNARDKPQVFSPPAFGGLLFSKADVGNGSKFLFVTFYGTINRGTQG
jgi:hypothetical protein